MFNNENKDTLGIIFFALGILVLIYMFITPLNQLICHIDEYFTLTVSTLPISEIITANTWDVHPPLHYFMGKIVSKLSAMFGFSYLFGMKVLSIIPYILILITSATKIRKDYGWFAAGLFAFSLAVMSEFFRYYLTARMYSWAILFVLLAFLCFKNIIDSENPDKKSWILLTLFSVLSAYTHYFAAMSAACIYLILLIYIMKYKRQQHFYWTVSVFAAVVLYMLWMFSLVNQLTQVHASYWIPEVNLETVILSLGHFANGTDLLFSAIAILILIAVAAIYAKESLSGDEKDQFFILSGIGVYLGTIILAILISIVFKPILMVRYLLPASAIIWLPISIMVSRIKNRRMFLISFALIVLLLISGVAGTVSTNDSVYQSGMAQKEIMDNITQDNNSMLIVPSQNMIMYFLNYADQCDMYCLNYGHVFGINNDILHKLFDFTSVDSSEIDSLIANNKDKNIYVISWNDPALNSTSEVLGKESGIVFSKVNTTDMAPADENTIY